MKSLPIPVWASMPADKTIPLLWTSDGHRHWLRVEVVGPDGKLWLIGNTIFINWLESNNCH